MYSDYNCNTYFMKTTKCPIVIPSYKNRVGNIVQHLEQVSDNKIYVFVYADVWNDWRNDNKISLNDALSVWDWFMKSDFIENDDDHSLDYKTIQQEIKRLKMECDFE